MAKSFFLVLLIGLLGLVMGLPAQGQDDKSRASPGRILIANNMKGVTISAWSVSNKNDRTFKIGPGGGTYLEEFRLNPSGGGISIKMSDRNDPNNVIQFEYTRKDNTIYWDVSYVNHKHGSGSSIVAAGFSVTSNKPGCPQVHCRPGDENCRGIYHNPRDDWATHGCPLDTLLFMKIG